MTNFRVELLKSYKDQPHKKIIGLDFLREQLHQEIPGAELMWYDSVLHTDGSLQWQSMLNEENFRFMLCCDSFFTDYHWKLGHLDKTEQTFRDKVQAALPEGRNLSTYDIYYGNDCYGRGTYAGGEYNTFEAVNEIVKYPLSIAVFGQAFTYECGNSFMDRSKYSDNEDRFWLGKETNMVTVGNSAGISIDGSQEGLSKAQSLQKMLQDWNITELHSGYGKWQVEQKSAQEFETIASHVMNEKSLKYACVDCPTEIKERLKAALFECQVLGVGPKKEDEYKVTLSIINLDTNEAVTATTDLKTCNPSGSPTTVKLKLNFPPGNPNPDRYQVTVQCFGKDVEYMGGNYGTFFKQEKLMFELSPLANEMQEECKYEKSLVRLFGAAKITMEDNFSCFFQSGMGASYFIDGIRQDGLGNYSNLTEFDWTLGFNKTLDNIDDVEITDQGEHFIGGSSLQVQGDGTKTILLQRFEVSDQPTQCEVNIVYRQQNCAKLCMKLDQNSQEVSLLGAGTSIGQTGWYRHLLKVDHQPSIFAVTVDGEARFGLFSVQKVPCSKDLTLELDQSHGVQVRDLVSSHLLDRRIADISFAWKFSDGCQAQHQDQAIKYFRVFRVANDKGIMVREFLGVTNSLIYVDRDVELENLQQLGYRVDAISHAGEVMGSLDVAVGEKVVQN